LEQKKWRIKEAVWMEEQRKKEAVWSKWGRKEVVWSKEWGIKEAEQVENKGGRGGASKMQFGAKSEERRQFGAKNEKGGSLEQQTRKEAVWSKN
jgi:hypothetical protein